MRSSVFSGNYGTMRNVEMGNEREKRGMNKTAWKAFIIGLFLIVVCGSVYYYGGFDSFLNKKNEASHGAGQGSNAMNKNILNNDVMSHISEQYYESMARYKTSYSNSKQRIVYGNAEPSANCDSLRSQLNEETQETTNKFYRYYSDEFNDYLYTVYTDEVDNAGDSYTMDGSAGYLWSGELPGVTEPLYRYINEDCNGEDHFYSTQLANYGASNWQQIAGFIMSVECGFNTALYEYYSESTCNHFYTINQNEADNLDGDFEYQRVVGYVAIE